jgi:DNA-binding MarR family transcriptional regulator
MAKPLIQGPIALDDHLCFSLYGTTIAVQRAYKPLLDAMGITYPQFLVLSTLWEGDGQTIGAIAERLALEPSTITPLVKRLEAAGFVDRQRNPADERQVNVRLTAKGRALRAETGCLAETLLGRSGMSIEQVKALNAQVKALRDALTGATP